MKTLHFWKAYGIGNQKKQCCHLLEVQYGSHFTKWLALIRFSSIFQPANNIKYENFTFLESLWHRQSEETMLPFARSPIWPPFSKWLHLIRFSSISQPTNNIDYENQTFMESLWQE